MDVDEARIDRWMDELTLDEKITLLSGASTWRTAAIDRIGIPAIKMSDGPNGVRGENVGITRTEAVAVPTGIAQGATWDPDLIGRVGDLLGREARRRGAHVLLAPAVNLHRTPIGGRTFEYFSEDPELTAALAVATVRGVQANDVAVTVKHFVANDTEVDRHTVDVDVDERVLRELYLRPFEACVTEAEAWGVMSSYNRLDGEFCAASDRLLNSILRDEWGFDGFVVSDWFGAHDAAASVNGGLSVEMPGPPRIHGAKLAAAIDRGDVEIATLDARVRDLLVLVERTGALDRPADSPETSVDDPDDRALARRVAIAGTVLATNDGVLPLATEGTSIAVIGPNAAASRIMGGGSSAVKPLPHASILESLRSRFERVVHEPGCRIDKYARLPRPEQLLGPDGRPGLELRFVNRPDGADPDHPHPDHPHPDHTHPDHTHPDHSHPDQTEPAHVTRSDTSNLRYFGSFPDGVDPRSATLVVRGRFVPETDGIHQVGIIVTGPCRAVVGGVQILERGDELVPGEAFYGRGSSETEVAVELLAGKPVDIEIDLELGRAFCGVRLGFAPPVVDDEFGRAVAAAAEADVAIVVAGTNEDRETEGNDRTAIELPGTQDELIRAVAAVNPRTVVVVNAGSPVSMPWLDEVGAVLLPFFGGMELGNAVADILTGATDPGGRLPITFPRRLEDCPAWPHYAPIDGVQTYGEGFAMGYRGHDALDVEPLLAFGHGLSYGDAAWGEPTLDATAADVAAGGSVTVTVPITATGDRSATVVVQGYVSAIDPPVERERKALKTWRKVVVEPGRSVPVGLTFGPQAFRRWDADVGAWVIDPGTHRLLIGASAADIRASLDITIGS